MVRPIGAQDWLNLPLSPVSAKHRVVKFQEMSLSRGWMAMEGKTLWKQRF